jgi:hypothetical protein
MHACMACFTKVHNSHGIRCKCRTAAINCMSLQWHLEGSAKSSHVTLAFFNVFTSSTSSRSVSNSFCGLLHSRCPFTSPHLPPAATLTSWALRGACCWWQYSVFILFNHWLVHGPQAQPADSSRRASQRLHSEVVLKEECTYKLDRSLSDAAVPAVIGVSSIGSSRGASNVRARGGPSSDQARQRGFECGHWGRKKSASK